MTFNHSPGSSARRKLLASSVISSLVSLFGSCPWLDRATAALDASCLMRRLENRNRAIFKEKRDADRCDETLSGVEIVERPERETSL